MIGKILNSRGFSLVESLTAAGLLGLVGVLGMQVQKSSTSAMLMQESTIMSQSIVNQMENYLETVASCTQTLGGKSTNVDSTLSDIKDKNGSVVFLVGKEYDGVVLTSLKLLKPVAGNATRIDPVSNVGFVDLQAKFLRKDKSMGSQEMTRKIRLWILVDPLMAPKPIVKCSAMTMSDDNLWKRSYWDASKIFYSGGIVGVGAPVGSYTASQLIVTGGKVQAANTNGDKIQLESSDGTSSFKIRTQSNLPVVFWNETTSTTIDTQMNSLIVHMAIQPGTSSLTCSAVIEGAIRFNSATNADEICGLGEPSNVRNNGVYKWMPYK